MDCLVVVAHPDDEIIWMGGTILSHLDWHWQVLSLCRGDDPDRAPRFNKAAQALGASASISDLDDSPVLVPLSDDLHEIKDRITALVPANYDLIFTHGPKGEYTRHERHEQVHRAVREMLEAGRLSGKLLTFSYDDCEKTCVPRPSSEAQVIVQLSEEIFNRKRQIIREIYGFGPDSFEYGAAGPVEAFSSSGQIQTTELQAVLECKEIEIETESSRGDQTTVAAVRLVSRKTKMAKTPFSKEWIDFAYFNAL